MTQQAVQSDGWRQVASVHEIPPGKMKHYEVEGKEILIANVGGSFYAISDRCGHMNARLSSGGLSGNIVTCPQHAAQFDVTTGRKRAEPTLGGRLPDMDKLPSSFLKMIEHAGKIMAEIKTYDQRPYPVSTDGKSVKVHVPERRELTQP